LNGGNYGYFYHYICNANSAITQSTINKATPFNDTAGNEENSLNFLDRHDVECPSGYGTQQFKLKRSGSQIAYDYRCVQIKNISNCGNFKSEKRGDWDSKKRTSNLYGLNVGNGQKILQRLKLNSEYAGM